MTVPEIIIRPFSNDQHVLDKVLYGNIYRLKTLKTEARPNPVVLDIGAHCGYFSLHTVLLGASKVYSLEPYLENFKVLLKNTEWISDKVVPMNIGVQPSSGHVIFSHPEPKQSFYDFENIRIENKSTNGYQIGYCTNLKVVFNMFLDEKEIDLTKINMGYHADIFDDVLKKSKNVCGECDNPEDLTRIVEKMTELGFKDSQIAQYNDSFIYLFSQTDCNEIFDIANLKHADLPVSKSDDQGS